MAKMKKNTAGQVLFTMVDNVDFASIRSNLVMASLTCTVYGVKHGGSVAAHVLAASKAASIVRSGLYRWPLKSTEISDADQITVYITAAAGQSAADQILQYEVEDITTADISATLSDIQSYLVAASGILSDITSAVSDLRSVARSHFVYFSAVMSDTYSSVSDLRSYVRSQFSSHVSAVSDLRSYMRSQAVSLTSAVSDLRSVARSHFVYFSAVMSDTYSSISDLRSYVRSSIQSASNIMSKVWNAPYSDYVAASTFGSVLANRVSLASDIASQVWAHANASNVKSQLSALRVWDASNAISDFRSVMLSAMRSRFALAPTSDQVSDLKSTVLSAMRSRFTLAPTSDQISDFRSHLLSAMRSRFALAPTSDQISDVHSKLLGILRSNISTVSGYISDIRSLVTTTGVQLNASSMSDLRSAIAAGPAATITASDVSNIASAVWAYTRSMASGTAGLGSYLYKNISDIQSKVASTATAGDVGSAVWSIGITTGGFTAAGTVGSLLRRTFSDVSQVKADTSDLRSYVRSGIASTLSDVHSLISSRLTGVLATKSQASHLRSFLVVMSGVLSDTYSSVSDLRSYMRSQMSSHVSAVSDLRSYVRSQLVYLSSISSDTYSSISDLRSYMRSQVASLVSSVSDLRSFTRSQFVDASATLSNLGSAISDLRSYTRSQFVATSGILSDIGSSISDLRSFTRSQFVYVSATLSNEYSMLSDLHSYVDATLTPSNLTSYFWVTNTTGSDFLSKMLWVADKFGSRVTGVLTTNASMVSYFSDLKSTVSKVGSDLRSLIVVVSGELSNIQSMVVGLSDTASKIYGNTSDLRSFVRSGLSNAVSDFRSATLSALRSQFLLTTSTLSDIQSYLVGMSGMLSDTHSAAAAAAAAADITSIASGVWAHANASNLKSQVSVLRTLVTLGDVSMMSDIRSVVRSQVGAVTASVDNISVASAVWAHSRASNLFSMVGGLSNQISDFRSVALSVIRSGFLAGGLTDSAMSDIASRVWATSRASNLFSKIGTFSDQISDVKSAFLSSLRSNVAATSNQVSDYQSVMLSAMRSRFVAISGELSNTYSMVVGISDAISDFKSMATVQFAGISDTVSDIRSAITVQDAAFTDATTLTANTLKDRMRNFGWVLRNKMVINDTTGAVTLYKDDNATTAYTIAGGLLDDGTNTTRKRLE